MRLALKAEKLHHQVHQEGRQQGSPKYPAFNQEKGNGRQRHKQEDCAYQDLIIRSGRYHDVVR